MGRIQRNGNNQTYSHKRQIKITININKGLIRAQKRAYNQAAEDIWSALYDICCPEVVAIYIERVAESLNKFNFVLSSECETLAQELMPLLKKVEIFDKKNNENILHRQHAAWVNASADMFSAMNNAAHPEEIAIYVQRASKHIARYNTKLALECVCLAQQLMPLLKKVEIIEKKINNLNNQ